MNCFSCDCLFLGCFASCDEGYTFEEVMVAGLLTYEYEFNGFVHRKFIKPTVGEPYVIPFGGLNEDYEYKVQILGPDGEKITLAGFDCFTFKLTPLV